MVRECAPGHPAQGQEAGGVSAGELGRGLGQRSRPGDDAADRRKAAKAANDGAAAVAAAKADGDDMFTRAGEAAE
jgi:hypothetical protein